MKRVQRRGTAVAAAIVMLGLLNLLVIGAIRPGADESLTALERVESARALHAAESGMRIVLQLVMSGQALPSEGSTVTLGESTIEFVSVAEGGSGEMVVEGRSGASRRRVSAIVQ